MENCMKVIHYDLFAGIGGFSLAIDWVFGKTNVHHIFSEIDPFCIAILKKHWPEGEYYGDIREFITNASSKRLERKCCKTRQITRCLKIVTGGFPCQPFSQAGPRKGTQDNRYLWPEMFRAIQTIKPQIVIAENVYGILTTENGMVFEQVCSDLETEGYEVQAFIIPACAVNAPHRRDRIWIVAYFPSERLEKSSKRKNNRLTGVTENSISKRRGRWGKDRRQILERKSTETESARPSSQDWERDWKEVAFATCVCGMDDGVSRQMDGTTISQARWRKEALKALGNAIVPPVVYEILKAIKEVYELFECRS
jgi:DNA (cytosine-5)-methyltransferase 1